MDELKEFKCRACGQHFPETRNGYAAKTFHEFLHGAVINEQSD